MTVALYSLTSIPIHLKGYTMLYTVIKLWIRNTTNYFYYKRNTYGTKHTIEIAVYTHYLVRALALSETHWYKRYPAEDYRDYLLGHYLLCLSANTSRSQFLKLVSYVPLSLRNDRNKMAKYIGKTYVKNVFNLLSFDSLEFKIDNVTTFRIPNPTPRNRLEKLKSIDPKTPMYECRDNMIDICSDLMAQVADPTQEVRNPIEIKMFQLKCIELCIKICENYMISGVLEQIEAVKTKIENDEV